MTEALVDPVVFNPYDYDFHDDPYPIYARLRDESPLYHNPEIGFWALSRHSDVLRAFRDSTRLSSANGVSLDPAAYGPHAHLVMSFLAMDDRGTHACASWFPADSLRAVWPSSTGGSSNSPVSTSSRLWKPVNSTGSPRLRASSRWTSSPN